jgi:Phage tail tube protein, GTA-gp10
MAHSHRGEIDAVLDGRPHRLCLTLGALADLETAFGDADLLALAERFSTGRVKAADATRLIGAGLRGGGHPLADDVVATMTADGGAAGFIDIIGRLLAVSFGPTVGGLAGALAGRVISAATMSASVQAEEPRTPPDVSMPSTEEARMPAPIPTHPNIMDQTQ